MNKIRLFLSVIALLLMAPLYAGNTQDDEDHRLAANVGEVEAMTIILDKGIPVDSKNKFGKNALMMAVENDNFEAVVLLLSRRAEVNARTKDGCTALTFAAENGHPALIAMLLEQGANLRDRTRAGWDSLMIASRYGITNMIEQLLYKGADPKASDKYARNALMMAAENKRVFDLVKDFWTSQFTKIDSIFDSLLCPDRPAYVTIPYCTSTASCSCTTPS